MANRTIPENALVASRKINTYLNKAEPELVYFLQTLWRNQGRAITYKEIREALIDGYLTEQILDQWFIDYSRFVRESVAPMWQEAMEAANTSLSSRFPKYAFDPMTDAIKNWTNQNSAKFITRVCGEQVMGMRELIKRASQLEDMNVDQLSRAIRPMVGLTHQQSIANLNYYESMIKSGVKQRTALENSIKYSARQSRYRGYMIARTELSFAYNNGMFQGTKQAQEQGYLGQVVKVWSTAADERTCEVCGALDGKRVAMDDDFDFATKLTEPGIKRVPPAHPHCRCSVLYEEVEELTEDVKAVLQQN